MNDRKYFRNGCKSNKGLVQSIDQLMIESVHDIIEMSILITYISNTLFGWSLGN